ncbi:MAG: RluA family pseudouridine synthase [Spirochaetia bacterium]|jgi:23S rRNA pseudouridine1911/1915/1917 synthase
MSTPRSIESRVEQSSDAGMRLDVYVSERLGLFSRSQARARIVSIEVNGAPARLARRVRLGDVVTLVYADPPAFTLPAQDIPLSVIFENDDVIVIDKPQGMVVHPGSGNPSGTLLNALLFRNAKMAAAFGPDNPRPGIVHRLDKETSGVIIAAKNARAHEQLAVQFKNRTVRKRYVAVVQGAMPAREGRIEARLARDPRNRKRFACVIEGGRTALTRYRTVRTFAAGKDSYSLVLLAPSTGRTHQLRVHLRHLSAPILGDPLYGRSDGRFPDATLMLHARSLSIRLPGEAQARTFVSPLPERIRAVLGQLHSFSPNNGL